MRMKIDDRYAIQYQWYSFMNYPLNLHNPKTYCEKLQWLKLYDRNPIYTTMVDKHRVKEWIANKVGEEYVIPTLMVYDSVDEINLDQLPQKFVLKCNHDSGSVVICHDKSMFDLESAKKKLGWALKHNYYWNSREWPYKHVKKCVIAEQFLEVTEDHNIVGSMPQDYKFYCFNGEPRLFYITSDRENNGEVREDFFDLNGNLLKLNQVGYYNNPNTPALPKNLGKMIAMARVLAKGTYHLRVDFYEVNGNIFVGELTFFDGGGYVEFIPTEYNAILGSWIHLPIEK